MLRFIFTLGAGLVLTTACAEDPKDPGNFGSGSATASSTSGGTDGSTGSGSGGSSVGSSSSASAGTTTTTSTTSTTTSASGTFGSDTNSTGGAGCGNGSIDAGEQCDGVDLNGFDCSSLGYSGGSLSCDGVTCTFDTSLCMSGTAGTSG